MKYCLYAFLFSFCSLFAESPRPQDQILVVKEFISKEEAKDLITFYNTQRPGLATHTDNELPIAQIRNGTVRNLISTISRRTLNLLESTGKTYYLDHAGLYSRIKGNFCPYHADNISFSCPTHGNNQQELRDRCPGTCLGAKFIPNHTAWREYTALIYLNDNFEGGEISFEDGPQNRLYKKTIPIEARQLVLAPNGNHFYHEVFLIRSGTRYSLHLWYTTDPRHASNL